MTSRLLLIAAFASGCTSFIEGRGVDLPEEAMVHGDFHHDIELIDVDGDDITDVQFNALVTVISDDEDFCDSLESAGGLNQLDDVNALIMIVAGYGSDLVEPEITSNGSLADVAFSLQNGRWWTHSRFLKREGGQTILDAQSTAPEDVLGPDGTYFNIKSGSYPLGALISFTVAYEVPLVSDVTTGDAVPMDARIEGQTVNARGCRVLVDQLQEVNAGEPEEEEDTGDTGM